MKELQQQKELLKRLQEENEEYENKLARLDKLIGEAENSIQATKDRIIDSKDFYSTLHNYIYISK